MLNRKKKHKTENLNEVGTENNNQPTAEGLNEQQNTVTDEQAAPVAEADKLKEELAQANDKYLRLYAEFDNFKRRTTKERIEQNQTAGKEVIVALLPVLDDFDRALKAMGTTSDINAIKEGVALVQHKLKNILSQKGLKEMESKGTTFDADLHEAITNIPAPSDDLKGKVVDELEKGYYLNDKVVRFAKVVVGA
jgi:molecular chaperone GrpE